MPQMRNKLRKAAQLYIFEGKGKMESLREAGYRPSYVKTKVARLFGCDEMQRYIKELRVIQEQKVLELWDKMANDAPKIYEKYKQLAESTKSDDVKRSILSDLLDRVGYRKAKQLDIHEEKTVKDENLDDKITEKISRLQEFGIKVH